jgi:NADH-quinone oxidoreductase subunit N
VLACAVTGVVIFGIYPNPLVQFAMQAALTFK